MRYDTYDISFPTFDLKRIQDEKEYMVDRCDNVDSYVDMNSEFDMHCVDFVVKKNDKSEVIFLDLQVVNELLISDNTFSCLQEADRNCDQHVEVQSFYLEMFLSSLQAKDADECFLLVQTSGQDVPDVPSFQMELGYSSF